MCGQQEGDSDDRGAQEAERRENTGKGASERCVRRRHRIFWCIIIKDLIIIPAIFEVTINYTSDHLLDFLLMLALILQSRNHLHLQIRKPGFWDVN